VQSQFLFGLVVGLALGGAGTYAALEKPWADSGDQVSVATIDAGASDPGDSEGKGHKKRRRKGRRGGGGDEPVALQEIDERIVLTAADRVMVWRGPKIALPEKNMDFAAGGGGRNLNQGEINDAVNGGQNRLMSCVAEARGQAELATKITLKILVEGNGNASKVRIQAPNYLMKNGLYTCASSAVRSMNFPGTGAATIVTVPLDLSF
jgi:hypothetical protein